MSDISPMRLQHVVELWLPTPQQLPVIGCCPVPQTEADNKGCCLSMTQLLMTGSC